MSIRVELDELADAVARQAPIAYLLTVRDDQRVHVVAIAPDVGETVVCQPGNSACRNAAARPAVTLVWPPAVLDGKTLLVDGTATVDDSTGALTIAPTSAILHVLRR